MLLYSCYNVDGVSRVKNDLEIVCFSGDHIYWAYGVAAPGILVWGLGIPTFAALLMFKDKNKLTDIGVRERYGFLFRGYKKSFFFWESIIMYRKIMLIFIQVFLVKFGVIS